MMSTGPSLQQDALRLAELDRKVVRAVLESDNEDLADALIAYVDLRKNLKTRLLDESAIPVSDADAAAVVRKVTTGEGLPSDKVVEWFEAHGSDEISSADFDEEELSELGSRLFYSWFSHHEYIRGLAELRPLILQAAVPEAVAWLLGQVRNCYAFQQYDAAYALCRMVIEASVRDICVRRQLFPDLGDNVVLFEKYPWLKLRDKVASGPLRERLRILYADLSTVVHGRKSVTREEAYKAVEETLQVVEALYAENGL
jgi:hypothetical protein